MSTIRYHAPLEILLVTKGHAFDRNAFAAIFEDFPDVSTTQVEQPAAQHFFCPEAAADYDAIVLYDMPGIEFRAGMPPRFHEPPPDYVEGFRALLEAGKGLVFLHHAIAGWPAWPEYAEIIGGRFLYQPGELRGEPLPDSGYRHDVRHRIRVVDPGHPVVEGIPSEFEIVDEVYLFRAFEDSVTPLLRSNHTFEDSEFYSAARALEGKSESRKGWSHPPGADLIGWTHRYHNSPIVYLACGDGPSAYESTEFRQLIRNAIGFVAGKSG
ncbi:MAG: ThuA domain-containing protein [bacterium]|nr:ThuA domain-containing protein [bacterium]